MKNGNLKICVIMHIYRIYTGTLKDNINAIEPGNQPKEYYETLSDIDKKILDAYGYEKFPDFLGEHI